MMQHRRYLLFLVLSVMTLGFLPSTLQAQTSPGGTTEDVAIELTGEGINLTIRDFGVQVRRDVNNIGQRIYTTYYNFQVCSTGTLDAPGYQVTVFYNFRPNIGGVSAPSGVGDQVFVDGGLEGSSGADVRGVCRPTSFVRVGDRPTEPSELAWIVVDPTNQISEIQEDDNAASAAQSREQEFVTQVPKCVASPSVTNSNQVIVEAVNYSPTTTSFNWSITPSGNQIPSASNEREVAFQVPGAGVYRVNVTPNNEIEPALNQAGFCRFISSPITIIQPSPGPSPTPGVTPSPSPTISPSPGVSPTPSPTGPPASPTPPTPPAECTGAQPADSVPLPRTTIFQGDVFSGTITLNGGAFGQMVVGVKYKDTGQPVTQPPEDPFMAAYFTPEHLQQSDTKNQHTPTLYIHTNPDIQGVNPTPPTVYIVEVAIQCPAVQDPILLTSFELDVRTKTVNVASSCDDFQFTVDEEGAVDLVQPQPNADQEIDALLCFYSSFGLLGVVDNALDTPTAPGQPFMENPIGGNVEVGIEPN